MREVGTSKEGHSLLDGAVIATIQKNHKLYPFVDSVELLASVETCSGVSVSREHPLAL